MTKIFSFYRTKQADPLQEEEEALAAAEEYRDLEDGSGGKDGDDTPGSGSGARRDGEMLCFVAYLATIVGIGYVLFGSFYLPPEAGADGGGVIVLAGGVILAVAVPVLVGGLAVACWSRRRRRGSNAPSCIEG